MAERYKPCINIGPGDIIRDELAALNWTQEDLSSIMGMTPKAINEILTNKSAITIETARLLNKALGPSAQFWLNADASYRLRLESDHKSEKEAETKAIIYKYMPIREMVKKRWLKQSKNANALVKEVKEFWEIDKLDFSFMDEAELPNFRKSDAYNQYNSYYAQCWYKKAKKSALEFKVERYSKKKLKELSHRINLFTVRDGGIEIFIKELNSIGVKFFVLPHLQKTYIDGASFFDGDNPVIVTTCRYNRNDNFWFTIAHEIAHILLHLKKGECFLDNLEKLDSPKEREADDLASGMLEVNEVLNFFKGKTRYISRRQISECSDEQKIAPGIIVGVLQFYGKMSRKNLNRFKETIIEKIPGNHFVGKY